MTKKPEMKKLVLDISNCRLNDFLEKDLQGIKQIPISVGRYDKDYDVVEGELPSEMVNALRKRLLKGFPAGSEAFDLPLCINMFYVPDGAEIKEIES